MQSGGAPQGDHRGQRTISLSGVSLQDLSRIIGSARGGAQTGRYTFVSNVGEEDDFEDDDDDEEGDYFGATPTYAREAWKGPKITEPQQAGVELLNSGDFGRVANKTRARRNDANLAKLIFKRATELQPTSYKEDYANVGVFYVETNLILDSSVQNLVPNSDGTAVAAYDANIYTGQYSAGKDYQFQRSYMIPEFLPTRADSSFYYTCSQGKIPPPPLEVL